MSQQKKKKKLVVSKYLTEDNVLTKKLNYRIFRISEYGTRLTLTLEEENYFFCVMFKSGIYNWSFCGPKMSSH